MSSIPQTTVLEIVGNAIVGGMEACVSRLVERLVPDRFSVVCLCPFESSLTRTLRNVGAQVYVAPLSDHPQWESLQFAATLVRLHDVQVIHAHLPSAHLMAGLVSALTGIPAFATIHGRGIAPLDFEISQLASTHLSVVCESARIHAHAIGVPAGRVHLIPNGVDAAFYAVPDSSGTLNALLNIPIATPIIGFVGRLAAEKAPDVFVRMAALTRTDIPDACFVLVGDGPMRQPLERLVKEMHLEDRVKFAGLQTGMRAIYQSLSLFVSSSYAEGMPLALLEAMASGCATVATHVGGVPDIVEAGSTGLLVRPGDAEQLAAAVTTLLKDHPLRTTMGEAARQRVAASFPLSTSVEATAALMRNLITNVAPLQRRGAAVRKIGQSNMPAGSAFGTARPR